MSPLRARMIEDMTLAGLAEGTQKIYIQSVRRLAAHYLRPPDRLSEEEVRTYLLGLRQGGAARGTFKTSQYGLRFLYCHTLDRYGGCSGKKRIASPRQKRLPESLSEDQVRQSPGYPQPGPQDVPCRHVCVRSAHQRGHHAGGQRH